VLPVQNPLWKLLEQVQPDGDRVIGLLFVAANEGAHESMQCLIQYDKLNTQAIVGIADATAATRQHDSVGRSGGRDLPKRSTRLQRQQADKHQQGAARLQQLEQLLLTCLTANHVELVNMLIEDCPAVALLGELHWTGQHAMLVVYAMP
jgi:hypothetical protein